MSNESPFRHSKKFFSSMFSTQSIASPVKTSSAKKDSAKKYVNTMSFTNPDALGEGSPSEPDINLTEFESVYHKYGETLGKLSLFLSD